MPELPDCSVYKDALERHVVAHRLRAVRMRSPFLLRSVEPPLSAVEGETVTGVRLLGKRIVLAFEGELFLVLHLMIAGRLRWRDAGSGLPGRIGLAAFDFESGSLLLTEAGTKKRASLHVGHGEEALAEHDRGGISVLDAGLADFEAALFSGNHTLKRALCDPCRFSGIGNAYSDEILHDARISPLQRTSRLDRDEIRRLHRSTKRVMKLWIERLRKEAGDGFPEKVSAFRDEMAVHGKHGQPCPVCEAPVQRIVYAANETNYCPRCQTGGRILKDRALSRLLKDDWPRSLDEL